MTTIDWLTPDQEEFVYGQRVKVTAGPYRGQEGTVRLRQTDSQTRDVLFGVRLTGGEEILILADSLAPLPPQFPSVN